MANQVISLRTLKTFGGVAAEDDALQDYFLKTDAVKRIEDNGVFVVLGRKGSGKTALVRHFAEKRGRTSKSVNLRGYPWAVHAQRVDKGASEVEAYVASWRYLIAVELASLVLAQAEGNQSKPAKSLRNFFKDNYGGVNPTLGDVLRPSNLKLSKLSFEPQVLGNKLGGISLDRSDLGFGRDLEALTQAVLNAIKDLATNIGLASLTLHFDELDQGLTVMDESRKKMFIGLLLAARGVRKDLNGSDISINPVVYLRTDIWEELEFSDKNKITQQLALHLNWDSSLLKKLINERLAAKFGKATSWENVSTEGLMRGSQTKWDHMLARTFLRPRDIISFLNSALEQAKKRNEDPLQIDNVDVVNARDAYSLYLKQELDDEIIPHWKYWEDALRACSAMTTLTFDHDQFVNEYNKKRSKDNSVTPDEALQLLYDFSVIAYERRSGYGGSSWVFQYINPEAGWDTSATRFKVHLGLKEYAKLREERSRENGAEDIH